MKERSRGVLLARTAALLALGAALVACSDDKGSGGGQNATTTTAPTTAPPTTVALADGTISVSVTAIAGQAGKALVVMVIGDSGPVASACVQIASASLVVSPIVLTEVSGSGNPCSGSTTPKVFAAGTYTVTAGIFVPPATSAEKSVTQTVKITGPGVAAQLDGSALSA